MNKAYIYETSLGRFLIAEDGQCITAVNLIAYGDTADYRKEYEIKETKLLSEAAEQLREYFAGTRREFTLKLNPKGTDFQKKVWKALLDIPYGETRSYKQIAEAAGNVKACRAVGMANHNNPIMIIIPCHRVIGADGSLVGYGGGLNVKEKLLSMEKSEERK